MAIRKDSDYSVLKCIITFQGVQSVPEASCWDSSTNHEKQIASKHRLQVTGSAEGLIIGQRETRKDSGGTGVAQACVDFNEAQWDHSPSASQQERAQDREAP